MNHQIKFKLEKMTTEVELKYQLSTCNETNKNLVEDITRLLKSEDVTFEMNQSQLANDYYDTDALALRAMDFGLRIRTKGNKYEQTIKTAGTVVGCLHQRPEYNIDLVINQLDLSLFDKTIWPENIDVKALEKAMTVIFSTNFHRQTWLITQGENVIELALDRGEISTMVGEPTITINELEIELVNGGEQALFDLAKKLKAVVAMEPGKLSKAARGYALFHDKTKKYST